MNSGPEFPSMCAQLKCRKGALKMSGGLPGSRSLMPYWKLSW